ncbi:MAG: hypothetical protein JXQ93_09500 [Flavobacteriaceae bacterium]
MQNLIMFLFDMSFRDGISSEIFSYNYLGLFLGCEQVVEMRKALPNINWFQRHGIYYLQFLPSLLAFFILLKRKRKKLNFRIIDWFLVIISCFSVLEAIENSLYMLRYDSYSNEQITRILPLAIIFLATGCYIFFKIFSFKQQVQTITFGVLGFYVSFYLWFKLIGPKILPIVV